MQSKSVSACLFVLLILQIAPLRVFRAVRGKKMTLICNPIFNVSVVPRPCREHKFKQILTGKGNIVKLVVVRSFFVSRKKESCAKRIRKNTAIE